MSDINTPFSYLGSEFRPPSRHVDVVVVGAGLFGSIITRALRSVGRDVLLLDTRRKGYGSGPAACLIKPSWVSGLGEEVTQPSLALLNKLYGVETIKFSVGLLGSKITKTDVFWVNPQSILAEGHVDAYVNGVNSEGLVSYGSTGETVSAEMVVVAAGVWTNELIPNAWQVKGLTDRTGVAFTWPGQIDEPFIRQWAPYRQLVAFNRSPDEIWIGDGTAVQSGKWTLDIEKKCLDRCAAALDRTDVHSRRLMGMRPYVKDAKPCYLRQPRPDVWIATGGAKNGTLAAAWCAHQILETLK